MRLIRDALLNPFAYVGTGSQSHFSAGRDSLEHSSEFSTLGPRRQGRHLAFIMGKGLLLEAVSIKHSWLVLYPGENLSRDI